MKEKNTQNEKYFNDSIFKLRILSFSKQMKYLIRANVFEQMNLHTFLSRDHQVTYLLCHLIITIIFNIILWGQNSLNKYIYETIDERVFYSSAMSHH